MKLGKKQRLFFVADFAYSIQILSGIAGLALVTCLCAYLLIYNIMYLSVAGSIRYYGLLQTIGTTGRQIYCLIHRQMLLVGNAAAANDSNLQFFHVLSLLSFPWAAGTSGRTIFVK